MEESGLSRSRVQAHTASGLALGLAMLGLWLAIPLARADETAPSRSAWVDAERIAQADLQPDAWLTYGRTYDEQRYSPLTQLDRSNVAELGLAFSYATQTRRGMEATPLLVDGTLYTTGSWSRVYAVDAVTGEERWTYDPRVPRSKGRNACCDVVNRGVALWKGRVYVGTIDGRLIALDARTGKPVWEVMTVDPTWPYTITGAPRVVKGKVVIGNGGAELGVRGYFGAYDAETGELVWRFYTVPASSEGPHEHPELEMAAATWSKDSMWETGLGGTVWDGFAYDPDLDLLYAGVGNSSVYDRAKRSPGGGDNLFLASILAVRPDTGKLVWHYQTVPGEAWDYTATQHIMLADLEIGGKPRKVLMQAPKNGFFYVLDRATGELLAADPYVDISWATHVDLKTGRPAERPEADWSKEQRLVTPGAPGGHNWHPMAFSPRTGLVYVPTTSSGYSYAPDPAFRYRPGGYNTAEDIGTVSDQIQNGLRYIPLCSPTHITAWDPVKKRQAWRIVHESAVPAGVLATAGDLVFQGTGTSFAAYDARTGERLWSVDTGVGIIAPPITYEIDGVQYVAVMAGIGGSHGGHQVEFDYENEGQLLVFKRGGREKMPTPPRKPARRVEAPPTTASAEEVRRGRDLYARQCFYCHGFAAEASGLHPDLRYAKKEVHESWNDIVLGGTRLSGGMASFADQLSLEESDAIHAYVIERAHAADGWIEGLLRWVGQYACVPITWVVD
ncbi:MAG: PQQ-dependent dehydrogenase, methanol/ethanol family [Deltaproteobacteria bacterium]|nr:PQQ-dependent dehydrogenase, methanol/ethanol family [Deltaproteobacteria bacterium]